MRRLVVKVLKITGITLGSLLLLLFLAPILFPGTVSEKIKTWTNNSLNGELNFSRARLSFFNHFPSLTLTLYDFTLKGSAPFKNDTLVSADELALGINLKSILFEKAIRINQVFISDALVHVMVNEKGEANYNVYVSSQQKAASNTDTAGTSLRLEQIRIENSHLIYSDKSIDMLADAKGFNYTGKGDLSQAIFDLYSHAEMDSLDFYFGKEAYLLHKKINAELVTKINTHSLAFFFQKNEMVINRLPFQFTGSLNFLKNGYDIDVSLSADKTNLADLITALPPAYLSWQKDATVKGNADLHLSLKGSYIASENKMPDLSTSIVLRDGFVQYKNAQQPVTGLAMKFESDMARLNPDSLKLRCDSFAFQLGNGSCHGQFNSIGLVRPLIAAKLDANLDLDMLDKALGLPRVTLRGTMVLHADAKGSYVTGPNPNSIRHEEIVLKIPAFHLDATVKDGYYKYDSLPMAVSDIGLTIKANCDDGDYGSTIINIEHINAIALHNFIKGHAMIGPLSKRMADVDLQTNLALADLGNIYPVEGYKLAGQLNADIRAKGNYDELHKTFPSTTASIHLQDGLIQTPYYPHPVEQIRLDAKINDQQGNLEDFHMQIDSVYFSFEDRPFHAQASFQNLDNLAYAIKANGELDLGKIYQVFARPGMNLTGFLKADLTVSGHQQDLMQGKYAKLRNQGSLLVKDISISSEYFPQPLFIRDGQFTFNQDEMQFRKFAAEYGQSRFNLEGSLTNAIAWAAGAPVSLKGNFVLTAPYINADELMAYAPPAGDSASTTHTDSAKSYGVIMIPPNLDLSIVAKADKISYSGLNLDSAKANLSCKLGTLSIKETGFKLIGSQVNIDGDYTAQSARKALFNLQFKTLDFDVRKAYNEIKIFHDMATSAAKAQGIISIDYHLKGVLDNNMQAVYPSLEGGGVVSVKDVKLKGMKMFSSVSKETGKDSLNNPSMTKVDIKSTVKNNVITIERFKFKFAGFRPRIEGQTSFNGAINIKMRLGLPPLGIVGIPIRITGTQENPIIKISKASEENVSEEEYHDQDSNQP